LRLGRRKGVLAFWIPEEDVIASRRIHILVMRTISQIGELIAIYLHSNDFYSHKNPKIPSYMQLKNKNPKPIPNAT